MMHIVTTIPRQAIHTKYLAPTTHRDARIAAKTSSGVRVVVIWNDELDVVDNHKEAARAMCSQVEWAGNWAMGHNGNGYTFVDIGG